MIVEGKRKAEFFLGKKLSDPKYTGKKFFVLSETGLRLFGGYKTKKEAKKRLGQVEFFKRRGNPGAPSSLDADYEAVKAGQLDVEEFARRHDVVAKPKLPKGAYWAYDCGSHANRILDKKYGGRGTWEYGDEGISWDEAKAGDYITWSPDDIMRLHQGVIIDPSTQWVESCWGVDGYVFQHHADNSPYGSDYRLSRIQARNPKKRVRKKATKRRRKNPQEVIACGKCYRWAFHDIQDKGGTLVHGVVQEPFTSPPRYYDHAWVERDGRVYDEKTMEGPHGGKFSGIGYPIDVYKELFKPHSTTRYTSRKAWRVLQDEGGHYGPWENPLPLPLGNPTPFWERSHDWNQVLIQKGTKKRTRGQILEYYKKNAKKIWPYLDGQTVMVIFGRKKNDFVLRRKGPDGKYIKLTKLEGIDDPHSYEYWIHRRVIEFHPVITGKTTGLIWIDVDPYRKAREKSMAKMQRQIRKAIPLMRRLLKDEFGVTKSYVFRSGKKDGGWHVEGDLPRKMNVDVMRKKLRAALDKYFADDPDFTTTIAKPGQIRLDTTLTKTLGSLRAPYSYTVDGAQKLPVKVTALAPSPKPPKKAKRRGNPALTESDYEAMKREVERGIEPEFEPLGMGTTRQVFEVSILSGDPFIFKADFGPKGRKTQTAKEVGCIQKGKSWLFPEMYDYDPKGRWMEVEMVEPLDALDDGEAIFEDLTGIDWEDFDAGFSGVDTKNAEQVASARAFLVPPGNAQAAEFFDELVRVSKLCGLGSLDLGLLENWGSGGAGTIKLIDLGEIK